MKHIFSIIVLTTILRLGANSQTIMSDDLNYYCKDGLQYSESIGGLTYADTGKFNNIKLYSSEAPSSFSLEQNYPNPFNPVTKINYSVSKASNVKIKVYDNLAREIMVLVNEYHSPGLYEVELNAINLSSGTYYYMMQAESFVNVKKLVLIK